MGFIKNQDYSASVGFTDKFICIRPQSGYGLVTTDPNFPSILLPLDCSNDLLGQKLIQALENSNTRMNNEECEKIFKKEAVKERWNSWLEMIITEYSYRSKRQFLNDLFMCCVRLSEKGIKIDPTYHSRIDGWEGLDESQSIILSLDNSSDEIGSGLRLAFSRCTSKYI